MTFAEQNLDAFIDLLRTQPTLFSQEKIANLKEFMSNIPDDTEQLSNAIANWYQKHPKILDAQLALVNKSFSVKGTGSAQADSNIQEYRLDKNTLLNAIQKSLSRAKDKNARNSINQH
ncbi:MAG: hypothetical protein WBA07_04280 [Rivularia sp. (in: cyanobacteria)]